MENINYPAELIGHDIVDQCGENSYYIRFSDEDIEELAQYAYELGYLLEPETMIADSNYPVRFKVISKTNPSLYGWVSRVVENVDSRWQDAFIYGFYRRGTFKNKYPITFNVQSSLMRRSLMRNADKNPRQSIYFRTVFGIMDLEPDINPVDFVLSWLSGCNINRI